MKLIDTCNTMNTMSKDTQTNSCVARVRKLRSDINSCTLDGEHLSIPQIIASGRDQIAVEFTNDSTVLELIEHSYQAMMADIKSGRPVYGSNSAFGGQADRVLNQGNEAKRLETARSISEGLVFLDITVGPELPRQIVRSAMVIRLNMLLKGVSGIRLSTLEKIQSLLNHDLIPVVHQYGGIGASGDLAHNQRIVSAARGLPGAILTNRQGIRKSAKECLEEYNLEPLQLDPKEGLALVNGDNFSTAVATHVYATVSEYYLIAAVVGAMTIEALQGSDRSFHPLLSRVRPHQGQKEVADIYRYLLKGSQLAHQELTGHKTREPGVKVQDGYSLRCIPQFEGVMLEMLTHANEVITINSNSTSDNPVWVPEADATEGETPWQWVSGGNFLAMHMAEILDQLRKVTTQLIKRNDRHLARLIDQHENNGLPANLADPSSVTHCAFKGVQIQSGMFDVYSMILAQPVTTLFGTHEERNQDVTSHALTSGIMALTNVDLLAYSLAMNLLAVVQAIDLRGGKSKLSPKTQPVYDWVRSLSPYVDSDRPLASEIEVVAQAIRSGNCISQLLNTVYSEYGQ